MVKTSGEEYCLLRFVSKRAYLVPRHPGHESSNTRPFPSFFFFGTFVGDSDITIRGFRGFSPDFRIMFCRVEQSCFTR